ncbi:MAG: winged helix-turn-helix transcriptional regulator [Alphaproteobacteria bacterium]|nr:winged helix-turn-helix transcriptional regulator [Alphaproteobacteria bacterium]
MPNIDKKLTQSVRESIDALVRAFKIDEGVTSGGVKVKMNPPDMHALMYISQYPKCMANKLSGFLGVAPTTVSSIIDRLVKKQLITRSRTEGNRRIVQLELTFAGKTAANAIKQEQLSHCEEMLLPLNEDERAMFASLLKKTTQDLS